MHLKIMRSAKFSLLVLLIQSFMISRRSPRKCSKCSKLQTNKPVLGCYFASKRNVLRWDKEAVEK